MCSLERNRGTNSEKAANERERVRDLIGFAENVDDVSRSFMSRSRKAAVRRLGQGGHVGEGDWTSR